MVAMNKVFSYQGSLPIKDDRVEEVIKDQSNATEANKLPFDQAEAEAACWQMINEQSGMYNCSKYSKRSFMRLTNLNISIQL